MSKDRTRATRRREKWRIGGGVPRAVAVAVTGFSLTRCSPTVMAGGPARQAEWQKLARLEARYSDARELAMQARITESRGVARSLRGNALPDLRRSAEVARAAVLEGLDGIDTTRLDDDDRRAWRAMRSTLASGPGAVASTELSVADTSCTYDATAVGMQPNGVQALRRRAYACYGRSARLVRFRSELLDRLTILERLHTTDDASERRALFLSLGPVWESMNGTNTTGSPFRTLARLNARAWNAGMTYPERQAASLGIPAESLEPMLVRILRAWRDATPGEAVEPWDWYYAAGAASRRLSPLVPVERLREINDRVYRELGANPNTLGIQYDLEPREGKTPVAFTDFGTPPRFFTGARGSGEHSRAEAWVFATYRTGGIDNLNELLHETGHAVHIAAIDVRPAFADWPDSDAFTEGVADLIAHDVFTPSWQRRYLGDSVATPVARHAQYAGVVLDVAWALFEVRMYTDPAQDPNAVWAAITSEYLHIAPHPEWSWWAARGQLLDLPGYMTNYALGAVVAAAVRARTEHERGPLATPRGDTYRWLSEHLYHWGTRRSARDVLREFLGEPLTEAALLADIARMRASGTGG